MKSAEKERLIKSDILSIESQVRHAFNQGYDLGYKDGLQKNIKTLPPVNPQPKTGHWIRISPAEIYECSECGQNVMTSDICAYRFCHGCGAKMVESPESEEG